MINNKGKFEIIHMDEFIDNLLTKESIFNIAMPQLTKRYILEDTNKLPPRKSLLDEDLKIQSDNDEEEDFDIFRDINLPNDFFKEKKRKRNENINENKPDKKQKIEDNINQNDNKKEKEEIDLSKLDPNSDEYWLAMRKKIGCN